MYLYADDCVLYMEIRKDDDKNILQTDLNNIASWCDNWLMDLNPNKYKFMTVYRQYDSSSMYILGDIELNHVSTYRYLGVTITYNITWNTHINMISNNADRTLGYLRRNYNKAPPPLEIILYKTLVRSNLKYAAEICNPRHANLTTS